MNSAPCCHKIPGLAGLYVDAFRGAFLRKTSDGKNSFILSHYHGDHYGSLPKDGKYSGPAKIHCTHTTAALLREIHNVPSAFVVGHAYGESFHVTTSRNGNTENVRVTFYDANHCPGAAIILVELEDGTTHLHTGDMRYHEVMKSYPRLRKAVSEKRLDTVLLDTTYGNPKHDFRSQSQAIESIASQAQQLLGSQRTQEHKTLILISCYSVGKERILWEVSERCNQRIYVSDKKMKMLQCILGSNSDDLPSQIARRCTLDVHTSDIHVIPMGLAGSLWPFFRPNFESIGRYCKEKGTKYERVVAFVPTGWADSSNWNRKHALSRGIHENVQIEVRLISYSEHSAFSELLEFVKFLTPRKVIPTVYKDEKEYLRIQAQFPIDHTRAKKHLLDSFFGPSMQKKPKKYHQSGKDHEYHSELVKLREMGFSLDAASNALRHSSGDLSVALKSLLDGKANTR